MSQREDAERNFRLGLQQALLIVWHAKNLKDAEKKITQIIENRDARFPKK